MPSFLTGVFDREEHGFCGGTGDGVERIEHRDCPRCRLGNVVDLVEFAVGTVVGAGLRLDPVIRREFCERRRLSSIFLEGLLMGEPRLGNRALLVEVGGDQVNRLMESGCQGNLGRCHRGTAGIGSLEDPGIDDDLILRG